jgi:hypothetical protein
MAERCGTRRQPRGELWSHGCLPGKRATDASSEPKQKITRARWRQKGKCGKCGGWAQIERVSDQLCEPCLAASKTEEKQDWRRKTRPTNGYNAEVATVINAKRREAYSRPTLQGKMKVHRTRTLAKKGKKAPTIYSFGLWVGGGKSTVLSENHVTMCQ